MRAVIVGVKRTFPKESHHRLHISQTFMYFVMHIKHLLLLMICTKWNYFLKGTSSSLSNISSLSKCKNHGKSQPFFIFFTWLEEMTVALYRRYWTRGLQEQELADAALNYRIIWMIAFQLCDTTTVPDAAEIHWYPLLGFAWVCTCWFSQQYPDHVLSHIISTVYPWIWPLWAI